MCIDYTNVYCTVFKSDFGLLQFLFGIPTAQRAEGAMKEEVLLTVYVELPESRVLAAVLHREGRQRLTTDGKPNASAGRWRPTCWSVLRNGAAKDVLSELFFHTFGVYPAVDPGSYHCIGPEKFGYAPHWGVVIPYGQVQSLHLSPDTGGIQLFSEQELATTMGALTFDDLEGQEWSKGNWMFDREREGVKAGYEKLLRKS